MSGDLPPKKSATVTVVGVLLFFLFIAALCSKDGLLHR